MCSFGGCVYHSCRGIRCVDEDNVGGLLLRSRGSCDSAGPVIVCCLTNVLLLLFTLYRYCRQCAHSGSISMMAWFCWAGCIVVEGCMLYVVVTIYLGLVHSRVITNRFLPGFTRLRRNHMVSLRAERKSNDRNYA